MPELTDQEVNLLNTQLEAALKENESTPVIQTLEAIERLPMTLPILRSTSIARAVGKLRKHSNVAIRDFAVSITDRWKTIVSVTSEASKSSPQRMEMDLASFLSGNVSAAEIPNQHTDTTVRFDESRVQVLKEGDRSTKGNVVYWMSRDQRICDNWALIKAQQIALKQNQGLCIIFCLQSSYVGSYKRHYGFMLRGLKELCSKASALNIPLHILSGPPSEVIPPFLSAHNVSTIVCDFSPLKIAKTWKADLTAALDTSSHGHVRMIEVDAHNIAPCFKVSNKCEFSAKTIRKKVHIAMDTYLTEFPPIVPHTYAFPSISGGTMAWNSIARDLVPQLDISVDEVDWTIPGEYAAWDGMRKFIPKLKTYADRRNDPSIENGVSNLSPYFHFGQLSAQRVLLEIKRSYKCGIGALFPSGERTTGIHSFCEEAVVRKELSDNFCHYNSNYDSIEGCHRYTGGICWKTSNKYFNSDIYIFIYHSVGPKRR